MDFRTDLALEAKQIYESGRGRDGRLDGVTAENTVIRGFPVTGVKISTKEGAAILCKPIGTYVTIELDDYIRREDEAFSRGAGAVAQVLSQLIPEGDGPVLVAGLGNMAVTPDSIGPRTAECTMATRHLKEGGREMFSGLRSVSVLETGVLGTTGVESAEIIKAVAEKIRPSCVIAVDALASAGTERLCRTVQISDAGIVPGSGVGNSRSALNMETLGVKVIAMGVPTVVDGASMLREAVQSRELREEELKRLSSMIVTPREIDSRAQDISKLMGYGINLALHRGITIDDINMFVS